MRIAYQLGLLLLLPLLSSCASLSYYAQSIAGHMDLMHRVEPIESVLARETTGAELRERLQGARAIRRFASERLGLPDNDSYKGYADLERPYVVWTVVATEAFSVEALPSCFLIVGCLNYRGYFAQADAQAYAARHQAKGRDVYIAGSQAYSTLGWFDDPLLNTMFAHTTARLAEVLIHELAHQYLYIEDDSAFNEAFATAVAQEGVRRWLHASHQEAALGAYEQSLQRRQAFNRLLLATRKRLENLYQSNADEAQKRAGKKAIFEAMQQDYQRLKTSWEGYGGYDRWMAGPINNAHLAMVATYHEQVPLFQALLRQKGGDLAAFYREAKHLATLPEEERELALRTETK